MNAVKNSTSNKSTQKPDTDDINDIENTYGPNSSGREKRALGVCNLASLSRVAQPKRLVQESCPFRVVNIYGSQVSG